MSNSTFACKALAVLLFLAGSNVHAQSTADTELPTAPNSDLPLIPTRALSFTTDEGTWMSLDLSPDGETIVFDLLGDLYTIPLTGGTARRITSGSGFDGQPRFAPDGASIVFVSDRSGSENLYLVDPDGENVRPLTTGRNQAYISPDWTPDGSYVVVSKQRDLWLFHRDGGDGLRLTGREEAPTGRGAANAPANFMGASVTPDGRYIYAGARTGAAGYNQMLATTQIVMYDRETGRVATRSLNLGTAFRPAVSPDGRWLVYGSSLTETIKQYMAGDRRQRQWIAMAAMEQRITPTLEGGLDFKKNLTEAMDGYAGIEHTLPIAPMYNDAISLLVASGTTYTPTLLVQYGGPWAENWWYEHYDILSDAKLARFTPFSELERRGLRRPQWFRDSEYSFELFAEQAKKLVEAGGRVGLGGHGQLQGLGVHWELWSIASGGMAPMDALRVGTIFGAEAIGLQRHVGSIEGGKLADILVLDANPLDDIRNTNTVHYVMKNGRLYDGDTLAELWPRQRPMPSQWWMTHDAMPVERNER